MRVGCTVSLGSRAVLTIAVCVLTIGGFSQLASATCTISTQQVGQQGGPAVLAGFEKLPKSLLAAFPRGGYGLEAIVTQLAARGPIPVAAIMSIGALSNPAQRDAMGRGLRQAADLCTAQDPAIVKPIEDAVARSDVREIKRAFNQMDDINDDTAATNGAGTPSAAPPIPGSAAGAVTPPPAALPKDLTLSDDLNPFKLADPFGRPEEWR